MTTMNRAASAEDIAALHAHLGDAHQAIGRALMVRAKKPSTRAKNESVLRLTTQDALRRMQRNIVTAMHSLEEPFVARAGRDTPFANPSKPDAWVEWLVQKAHS